jgi:CRP-like cAMP-binding protein
VAHLFGASGPKSAIRNSQSEIKMPDLTSCQKIAALRACPLFSALSDQTLADFIARCPARKFRRCQMLFTPADKAECFFAILSGQIKVFQLSPSGSEQTLHLYGPGDTVAEAAVWAGIAYPACAEAIKDSLVLMVSRKTLTEAITRDPELAVGMIAGLSGKLREFNSMIEQLALKQVPARLAAALLEESAKAGSATFRLPHAKRHLAGRIGTAAETLSRTLRKLQDQGIIKVRGQEITILNVPALKEIAQGE